MKKILSLLFVMILTMSTLVGTGCATETVDISDNPYTKYYKDNTHEFDFYACHTPVPGKFWFDGVVVEEYEDFRTAERYKEYADCGFNIVYIQGNDEYDPDRNNFEKSQLKKNLDEIRKGGLSRAIITDIRIHDLSGSTTPLVGEGCRFATYQDLLDYLKFCTDQYRYYDNGIVIGLMLKDEPQWSCLESYCLIYKALNEIWEGIRIDCCLLPLEGQKQWFVSPTTEGYDEMTKPEAYEEYLDKFCRESGAKRINMDSYPIDASNGNEYSIQTEHFRGLQILAKVAKKYNAVLETVAHSSETTKDLLGMQYCNKGINESEAYWQNNAYMMFGAQTFIYFTYWDKTDNHAGEYFTFGSSFIARDGTRTEKYYYMQRIHQEMQRFAKVIMDFKYQKVNYYYQKPTNFRTLYLDFDETAEDFGNFSELKNVESKLASVELITEMYDAKNNQYMYCVMNPQAPSNAEYNDVSSTFTLEFDKKYKAVEVWYNGNYELLPLENGKIDFTLGAGYSLYILPY